MTPAPDLVTEPPSPREPSFARRMGFHWRAGALALGLGLGGGAVAVALARPHDRAWIALAGGLGALGFGLLANIVVTLLDDRVYGSADVRKSLDDANTPVVVVPRAPSTKR